MILAGWAAYEHASLMQSPLRAKIHSAITAFLLVAAASLYFSGKIELANIFFVVYIVSLILSFIEVAIFPARARTHVINILL